MVGANTNSTIITGIQTSGDTSNWAMKLTKVENPESGDPITYNPDILTITSNYDDTYYNVPSTFTKVVEYKDSTPNTSSATDQTLGAHIETTYAAYVSGTQPADTYNGKVKYVLVHPATITAGNYSISYNANGGSGTMTTETNIPNYEPHTIPTSTITPPEGYVLAGWCTESDNTASSQNPQTTCNGTSYNDKGTIPASTVPANGSITLYAYWKLPPTMQNVATWKDSLRVGEEITVPDTRDGKEYTVAKLADGNIWMTQNLDHDIGDIQGGTYTSDDTDISSDWTPASSEYTKQTSNTTWNYSNTTPQSYDPGTLYWNGTVLGNQANCEAAGGQWISGPDICTGYDATSSTGNSHYKLGNYYNWTAAVAMSDSSSYGVYDEGTGSYLNTEANQSICPAGWRLPTYSGNKSFDNLVTKASLTAGTSGNIHTSPTYFNYGGGWSGSLSHVGYAGYYWSSVVDGSSTSYYLYFSASGTLGPQASFGRSNGSSVRCVSR